MMRHQRARHRRGYTLMEILVASVIGLILMGALYSTFSLVLKQSTGGRELTAEAELSRAVINRVGLDLSSTIGTLPPKSGGAGSGSSSSSSSDTTDTSSSSSGTTVATTAASTDASTTTTTTDSTTSAALTGADIPFQSGIVGVDTQVTFYISRLPKYLRQRFSTYDPTTQDGSDLIRVTYYLHSSGRGLCRQERPWVTADGIWNSSDPDRSSEESDLIAPEVVSLGFEYASGSGFTSAWDGSQSGTDGTTNQGPPRAVRMTFELEFILTNGTAVRKPFTHTYAIRAAAGLATSASSTTGTATATTSP